MQPRLFRLPDMKYSYIIEVKYAKRGSSEEVIDSLEKEAHQQLEQYSKSSHIQKTIGTTELIKIALVYNGWELVRFTGESTVNI